MTVCLYLSALVCYATAVPEFGYSSQYAAGVMEATIVAHQGWNHLPMDLSEYEVFGATINCDDMGREFLVYYDGRWHLGIVSDCSNDPATHEWFEQGDILLEVDYETAERWGVVGQGGVAISVAYVHCEIVPGSTGPVAI